MKGWIIYDGRAMFDIDRAFVLEACCEMTKKQLRRLLDNWKDFDAVLVEYDEKNNELTNERLIGHVNEGIDALMQRIS